MNAFIVSSDTTAQELLNDKPTEEEVASVDALWGRFNSTAQFLTALKQVMVNRELDNEIAALDKFLPAFAQVEADDMNVAISNAANYPIAQR